MANQMAVGTRVMVISHEDNESVHVYGEGVYEGDHPIGDEAAGDLAEMVRAQGGTNPRIRMDNGDVIWGCEAWFGEVGATAERLAQKVAAGKSICTTHSITETRAQFATATKRETVLRAITRAASDAWESDIAGAIERLADVAKLAPVRRMTEDVELVRAFFRVATGTQGTGANYIRPYVERELATRSAELTAAGLTPEEVLGAADAVAAEEATPS